MSIYGLLGEVTFSSIVIITNGCVNCIRGSLEMVHSESQDFCYIVLKVSLVIEAFFLGSRPHWK